MNLREISIAVLTKPKWMAVWYLTNSTLAGVTLVLLSRWGYVPFDDQTAFLLGFFAPLLIYGTKHLMGLYRYRRRLGTYQESEVFLQKAAGYYGHERYEDALTCIDIVLEYLPGHKRALFYAAKCYENLGRFDDAARRYSEYLILEPSDEEARERLQALAQSSQQ